MRPRPLVPALVPLLLLVPAAAAQSGGTRGPVQEICTNALRDQASGLCLHASTTPTLGLLYPLSVHLYVAPSGDVGVGTAAPSRPLDVVGVVRSRTGFEFPDGTIQTTANQPVPAQPQVPIGTIQTGGCSSGVYELEVEAVHPSGGAPLLALSLSKDIDPCTASWVQSALLGAAVPDAVITIGSSTLSLQTIVAAEWETFSLDGLLPRERLQLQVLVFELSYQDATASSTVRWNLGTATATVSPSLAGAKLTFVRPDGGAVPKGTHEVLGVEHGVRWPNQVQSVVLEKRMDVLTPSLIGALVRGDILQTVGAQVVHTLPPPAGETTVLAYQLSSVSVLACTLQVDAAGQLVETLELDAQGIVLVLDPDGKGPIQVNL